MCARSYGHETIDDAVELVQVPALFDHGAVWGVAIHFTVAEAPRHAVLGIEPDHLLCAELHVLQRPFVRQIVVVPRVAEHDHRRPVVHGRQMLAMERPECPPEVRVRVHVDDVAGERGVERHVRIVFGEELRHLTDVGDEDEAPHLRVEVLECVDELQHEARDVADGVRHVAQHDDLRLVLALAVEEHAEGHAAELQVRTQRPARIETAAPSPLAADRRRRS